MIPNAVVHDILLNADGTASGVVYRRPDSTDETVLARGVVLAANAHRDAEDPAHVRRPAVASPTPPIMVGRNLMDHPIQLSWALSGEPVFPQRGPLSTAGIETTRQAATRNRLSAFRVEVGNDGWRFPIGDPTFEFGHEANGTFVQLREGGKALARSLARSRVEGDPVPGR